MNLEEVNIRRDRSYDWMVGVILSAAVMFILWSLASCERDESPRCTYEVIDKTQCVESYYNWFTEKQVVSTVYKMALRNTETNHEFVTEVDDNTYLRFGKGDRFKRVKYHKDN